MAQGKERTGKPALLKELNIGLIMDVLQRKKQATRVELAALTNLSQPTVNMLMVELVKEQAVISLGTGESTGGRRAERFAINGKRAALAAVLIRQDVIEAVVTDLELQTELREKRVRMREHSCTDELMSLLSMLFERKPEIRVLSIGVPGSVSADGEVFSIPMIPEWEHFGLKEYLESRFPVSVCIMNDMNAIAAGYLLSEQEHAQNFVYLHAEDIGLGAGIVIDGRLYSGFRSFAGEVGNMLLGVSEGSVEEHMRKNADGTRRAAILTTMAVNLICVLNPEEILFGGDITEELKDEIYEGCRAHLPASVLPRCRVVSDYIGDYFNGLCRQGLEMLRRHVRVV